MSQKRSRGGKRLSVILARGSASALQLVLTLVLTRLGDPLVAAACLLQFSWAQLSSAGMAWGHPVAVLREASATYVSRARYPLASHIRWILINGLLVGTAGAAVFVALLDTDLVIAVFVAFAGFGQALVRATSQALKAYAREVPAILIEFALVPSVLIVFTCLFAVINGEITAREFASTQLVATVVSLLAIFALWRRVSRRFESGEVVPRKAVRFSGVHKLGVLQVLTIGAAQMPIVVAPAVLDEAAVASFIVAFRVASLVTTVQNALSGYYGPRYARAFARGDSGGVRKLLVNSQLVAALVCAPVILVVPWADTLLQVFGESYAQAALAYAIIAIGQYVNAVTGLVSYVLSLSHQESALLIVNIAALAILVIGWGLQWMVEEPSLLLYSAVFSAHMILRNAVNYVLARRVIRQM